MSIHPVESSGSVESRLEAIQAELATSDVFEAQAVEGSNGQKVELLADGVSVAVIGALSKVNQMSTFFKPGCTKAQMQAIFLRKSVGS